MTRGADSAPGVPRALDPAFSGGPRETIAGGGRAEPKKKAGRFRPPGFFLVLALAGRSYFLSAFTSSGFIVYAFVMITGSTGTSLYTSTLFVGTWRIFSTVSMPEIALPNTQ